MDGLTRLAGAYLANQLVLSPESVLPRGKAVSGLVLLSGILLCLGIGFLLYAAYISAMTHYPPGMAAALTGGLAILFALLIMAGVMARKYFIAMRVKKMKDGVLDTLYDLLEQAEEGAAEPIRENPAAAVALASLAGYAAGKHLL